MNLQEKTGVLSPAALEGAITRDGGKVVLAAGIKRPVVNGYRIAVVGDAVHYEDGRVAYIDTGSRAPVTFDSSPLAVVGSTVDNGDVIVSTPSEEVTMV